jgi:hypothetical protein
VEGIRVLMGEKECMKGIGQRETLEEEESVMA